jgi:Bacterial regulatory proteins, gntR family
MTTLKWELVADQLRRELQIGRVGANGELDTEAEMCDRFSVSRITIRRALTELRTDGLITSQRGSGSKATTTSRSTPDRLIVGAGPKKPSETRRTDVSWRTARPDASLVSAFRRAAEPGSTHLLDRWLKLSYDQRLAGTVFDKATVWFAPPTIPYVHRQLHEVGNTADVLQQAGVVLGRTVQTISAQPTFHRDQKGEAILTDLVLERLIFTSENTIAFVTIHRHVGSLVSFRVDFPTSDEGKSNQLCVLANLVTSCSDDTGRENK